MRNIFILLFLTISLSPCFAAEPAAPKISSKTGAITFRRPKIALALGGGGTRGVAHIGVLRVLEREGIAIDYIAGTSMGAIIGGLYCAGMPVDRIQQLLEDKQLMHAYYTVPLTIRVGLIPILFIPHLFGYHPYDGLYRGNKFAHFVDKELPEGRRNVEELHIPFCAVASDLLNSEAFSIRKGNLGRAIQASSAVPVLRRPVVLEDRLLVDGGIEANLPVKQAKAMGADIVIAVDVDEDSDQTDKDFRKILSVGNRVASMFLKKVDEDQVALADIVIRPDVNGIHILSTKISDAQKAVQAGEVAARAALPQIRAKLEKGLDREEKSFSERTKYGATSSSTGSEAAPELAPVLSPNLPL